MCARGGAFVYVCLSPLPCFACVTSQSVARARSLSTPPPAPPPCPPALRSLARARALSSHSLSLHPLSLSKASLLQRLSNGLGVTQPPPRTPFPSPPLGPTHRLHPHYRAPHKPQALGLLFGFAVSVAGWVGEGRWGWWVWGGSDWRWLGEERCVGLGVSSIRAGKTEKD